MTYKEYRQLIEEDKNMFRNGQDGGRISLLITKLSRYGSYLKSQKSYFAKFRLVFIRKLHRLLSIFTGIQIPIGSKLGGGIRIPHYGSIVVAASVKSGKNITILQNVTLGSSAFGKRKGYPILGNNIVIYSGAVICGNIHIGDNVIIGANSVVTRDVPSNSIVAGNPAKVICNDMISRIGSQMYSYYFPNSID